MSCFVKIGCALLTVLLVCVGCSGPGQAPDASAQARAEPAARPATELPKDIHADSRNRLPMPRLEELDDEGKKLLAAFQARGTSITESAPRSIRIYSPKVAEYMTMGNQYLRYASGLDPKLREVTILLAARGMDQEYEWAAHEAAGLKEGLSQEVIDIIKHGKPITAAVSEKEAAIIRLGREALYDHRVTSETFAHALQLFGKKTLVDIVALMGHYTATAILLNVFDQQLREGQQPSLPPLRIGEAR
jgi:4-carboxymuconolactone decarboxylase